MPRSSPKSTNRRSPTVPTASRASSVDESERAAVRARQFVYRGRNNGELQFLGRDLILQTPRYLEMAAEMAGGTGSKSLSELSKTNLFEKFIYEKLDIESEKTKAKFPPQRKEIIKRMLEKIALLMEIYQTNILNKEDLVTLFDDIKSNLSMSFLEQVPIDMLYDRTVLKNNITTVEFENTEFQEYLAAKEILRLGKLPQVVFDLTVDQEMREIFVSWFNTLTFLVDLDISILKPLLDFGASKNKGLQNEEYHRLLTNIDVNKFKDNERHDIFRNIFNYYQEILHWVPFDVARNLSYYFDCSLDCTLKDYTINKKGNSKDDYIKKCKFFKSQRDVLFVIYDVR